MKSGRENTVDLSCWQGGHQIAPQYSNSGLRAVRAASKAAPTSPPNQAMPGASAWWAAAGAAEGAGAVADSGAVLFEHCADQDGDRQAVNGVHAAKIPPRTAAANDGAL
jgi:hypothetical protein